MKKEVSKIYKSYWRHIRSLSCEEISALSAYKYNSIHINNLLRVSGSTDAKNPSITYFAEGIIFELIDINASMSDIIKLSIKFIEKIQKQINTLDSLFQTAPHLTEQLVVYRGSALGDKAGYDVEKLKKGSEFGTSGFFSTSYNINMALVFGLNNGVLFRVILPKGTPYILLPGGPGTDYSKSTSLDKTLEQNPYREQAELVLNRRSMYRVLNIERFQVSSGYELKSLSVKMYTIKYIGQTEPTPLESPEEIIKKIDTLPLPLSWLG